MELKDVLHFYIGQRVRFDKCNYHFVHEEHISKGDIKPLTPYLLSEIFRDHGEVLASGSIKIKLILRPLSSMTEEEGREISGARTYIGNEPYIFENVFMKRRRASTEVHLSPDEFIWFLKKGFDLFGLIEKGLAIDSITLKES